jgi:transcriptional regulator GlxA family with amidase domain
MRRIVMVMYEGATALDIAGPSEVFAAVARRGPRPLYRLELASVDGGMRTTSTGLTMRTRDLLAVRPAAADTVIVAGGFSAAVAAAMADRRLRGWLQRAAGGVERVASVCSGAFVLAAAGLLDERGAATHWMGVRRLARMFPRVTVDHNAIYVVDGKLWTSAGVSTGIDMALAMVEKDHGCAMADSIAAELVLYVRRPGFQSQFSESLVLQAGSSDPLRAAIAWLRRHLRTADVESLARAAALSVRTLHRRCREHLGLTPAGLIARVRVEHARMLLATSRVGAKQLAVRCGFGTPANMKRAFMRELGIGPRDYQLLHTRGTRLIQP